ncbi:MAG: cobalamin biosynthesis protein CobD [Deltaproteobacteria bacterium GWA2_54_12]|nr:MAG: cobalamin biosynthesis protein CobD [Deltaproteobacteria bacterium GWA2_54_12]
MRFLELLNLVPFSPAALVLGYILDLVIGDPERLPHPIRWIGNLVSALEKKLRKFAGTPGRERVAGVLLALLTVSAVYCLIFLLLFISYEVSPILCFIVSALFVWAGLSVKSLGAEAKGVLTALETGGIEAGRKRLSRIVGRDTGALDRKEVLRATVETVSENTSDGIIAPLFYLALGGPALMMAYKAVNTLDSMVGYKNAKYKNFGWFSARLDDAANYIPSRLAGVLAVSASFILGYNWKASARIMFRDGGKHPSPNSGVIEAAFAGALGVRFGGTSSYNGVPSTKPFIGDAVHSFEDSSIKSSIRLMGMTAFLMLLLTLAARTAAIFVL